MNKVIIGKCTLYHGDAYEIAPTLGLVDCMVADPQYQFETSGGGKMRKERKCLEDIIKKGLDQGFDHKIINPLLYKSVFVFCHNDQLHELLPYLAGSYLRANLLSWHKKNPIPLHNKSYLPDTEFYINADHEEETEFYMHAWQEEAHPIGEYEDKKRYIITNNGKSDFDHPTVKPLAVMEKIMRNVNGESVIDPFMGTGTTGVAAVKYGKRFIGIEKDKKYFDIACGRIEKAVLSTQEGNKKNSTHDAKEI